MGAPGVEVFRGGVLYTSCLSQVQCGLVHGSAGTSLINSYQLGFEPPGTVPGPNVCAFNGGSRLRQPPSWLPQGRRVDSVLPGPSQVSQGSSDWSSTSWWARSSNSGSASKLIRESGSRSYRTILVCTRSIRQGAGGRVVPKATVLKNLEDDIALTGFDEIMIFMLPPKSCQICGSAWQNRLMIMAQRRRLGRAGGARVGCYWSGLPCPSGCGAELAST